MRVFWPTGEDYQVATMLSFCMEHELGVSVTRFRLDIIKIHAGHGAKR